ncbi:reverse transcriptase [Pochonia chlamydosporia 170]|uniref:Reverse transcriptase n=1 Tax=Pochonia chlamydosporia 170 TaxID=1380566 RepID=A0A179EWB2_METCM|nr:reverse transcriptase [Pochonia chlamydosporia 170]OAQ57474.2 reverse transcriptase [Pochonia chlamydosporia 170]
MAMVISQPATPERSAGAQLDQQYPDSVNFRARQQLLKTGPPVTLQPFQPTSSPTRSLTAYDRDRGHRRNRRLGKGTQDSTTNRFAALAEEDDATETPTPVFDLEAETEEIIKTQKERLDIRAKVLRTYAEAITACTRKFTTGYGLHIANEFQNTLLRHWNQVVRAEEPLIPENKNSPAPSSLTGTNKATPPAPDSRENTRTDKLVSFDNIAENVSRQAPGDVHVQPHRRQNTTIADRTDRRVLLRLKSGSSFFEKGLQIRLALKDKLAIASQDIQDIKPTNTGWAIVARNEKIQQLILEKQNEWGLCIDLDIAEKQIPWHTYLIKNFPKTIHSWDGTLLDFETTIEEEIEAQTGQKPERWHVSQKPNNEDPTRATLVISFLKPLNSNFRLLGQGNYSFKLTKPKKLSQCTHCWNFHPPTRCTATKVCVRCGIKDNAHSADRCDNTTKCANCCGAHEANYENCYARPQKLRGNFQKLSKTQLIYARQLGQEDFKRKNNTQQTDSDQPPLAEEGDEDARPLQDAEMSGTEPIQTTQAPETHSVNIVDHEEREVGTPQCGK